MLDTCALNNKDARTKRSAPQRVYFQCTKPGCEFACNIHKGGDGLFRVTKWVWHTCSQFATATVKRSWVSRKAKELLPEREGLSGKELKNVLRQRHGVDVKVPAAMKAVAKARKVYEEEERSFDMLYGPFQALMEHNPGTVADIVMENGRLKMAFLCPGPCARAWTHCPKFIALDGTHGTSAYKGIVLVAKALDGSGQIFPIAIGFAPSDSNESWRFFVQRIADALNIRDTPLTVIRDCAS